MWSKIYGKTKCNNFDENSKAFLFSEPYDYVNRKWLNFLLNSNVHLLKQIIILYFLMLLWMEQFKDFNRKIW